MTYEEHLAAVRKNGHELSNVPERYWTLEMCLAAVQSANYTVQYIPDRRKKTCEAYLKLIGEQR